MNEIKIIGKINELLYTATDLCCGWLNKMLPRISDNWWTNCVLDSLSFNQNQLAQEKGYTELKQLDLAALLRVIDKNWYAMRNFAYLPTKDRETVRRMMRVRNTWAHISGTLPSSTNIQEDLQVVEAFFYFIQASRQQLEAVEALLNSLDDLDASELSIEDASSLPTDSKGTIREKSKVRLTSDPSKIGMVFSVETFGPTHKYEVFIDGGINTFYDGQIQLIEDSSEVQWEKIEDFRNSLTAYEINNPSTSNLYSLNSAKIDFVPYQFRPALKLIKSDEPRILIADSVGVGKTIEAGLIIKELEARNELESILIICPKPLVTERKWETEMKRFDEEFTALDGDALRETLNDCNRDGEWPLRSKKIIVPYSILDDRTYNGTKQRLASNIGLKDLDPAPHFDLVIVDEAHHIRNGSMEKDKAFAYKCVKYFCDHASAVVMLTATPLQTSDNDLFTLLNLLRPDVVIDKDVSKYGVIYGGVQKNIGPAGVVIVIIREDLIREDVLPETPTIMRYDVQAKAGSLYNTPPCYGIYICGKVFKWLKKQGGLEAMKEKNERKAKILYDYLDQSRLFHGTVRKEDRSIMNVPFVTGDKDLDALFVKEAEAAGFVNLKGHRTVGGMRASIYNAMPEEGVVKLVEFMKKFEAEHADA